MYIKEEDGPETHLSNENALPRLNIKSFPSTTKDLTDGEFETQSFPCFQTLNKGH